MAKRRSAKQRRASQVNILKAQKVSARKRRGRKAGILAVGGVAVLAGGAIAYRKYDRSVEQAQHKHISYKAWNARVKNMHVEYDDDILHARLLQPHKQPRRYSKRPLAIQTKRAIQLHRKTVLGRRTGSLVNGLENAILRGN